MSKHIRIRKGLSLKLKGEADKYVLDVPRSKKYAVKPTDFHGVIPKMLVKEGETVKAGQPLFLSKNNNNIKFCSPVSGIVEKVERGAKRKILQVVIHAENQDEYVEHGKKDLDSLSEKDLKDLLLQSGCWPFIKQRPYDIIANPEDSPKAIFVSAYNSTPLSASLEYTLKNDEKDFQKGISALKKLTEGLVHLSVEASSNAYFKNIKDAEIHNLSGCHPVGNVGTQIHKIDPINIDEKVWTVNAADVVVIGRLLNAGIYNIARTIALCGSQAKKPHYVKLKSGAQISDFSMDIPENSRVISGNIFTGEKIEKDGFLGFYHNEITVIPEGNGYRLFGWLPFVGNNIPSMYNTSLSFLFRDKGYCVNTNLNGEERAMVVTGKMERVFPFDIYPMQLLKECLAKNIDKMEALGVYEVAPEDFALIDFISTSKIEAQQIIREGLDLIAKEIG